MDFSGEKQFDEPDQLTEINSESDRTDSNVASKSKAEVEPPEENMAANGEPEVQQSDQSMEAPTEQEAEQRDQAVEGESEKQDEHSRQNVEASGAEEAEQLRKLFVGGLDKDATEDTLKSYFEKYGEITDCVVIKDRRTKKPKGFGFVTYKQADMVDRVQGDRPHHINGRELDTRRATPRDDSGNPKAKATAKRIFIRGLGEEVEEDHLRSYFGRYGTIINCNVVLDKAARKRKFAFVQFDDYDPVDKIVLQRRHLIDGRKVIVEKSLPKDELEKIKRKEAGLSSGTWSGSYSGVWLGQDTGGSNRLQNNYFRSSYAYFEPRDMWQSFDAQDGSMWRNSSGSAYGNAPKRGAGRNTYQSFRKGPIARGRGRGARR